MHISFYAKFEIAKQQNLSTLLVIPFHVYSFSDSLSPHVLSTRCGCVRLYYRNALNQQIYRKNYVESNPVPSIAHNVWEWFINPLPKQKQVMRCQCEQYKHNGGCAVPWYETKSMSTVYIMNKLAYFYINLFYNCPKSSMLCQCQSYKNKPQSMRITNR